MRPRAKLILSSFAIGAVGGAVVLASGLQFGPILANDTAQYFHCARSLAAGEGFRGLGQNFFTLWAPLYPLLLAPGAFFGLSLSLLCWIFNIISHGLLVALTTIFLHLVMRDRRLAWIGAWLTAFAWPLLWTAQWALSDPFFILLLTSSLYFMSDRFARFFRLDGLYSSAILLGLACVVRYAGIALIPVLVLHFFLLRKEKSRSWIHLPVLILLASGPLALWFLRNFLIAEAATGHQPVDRPLLAPIASIVETLELWVHPTPGLWLLPFVILLFAVRQLWPIMLLRQKRAFVLTAAFAASYLGLLIFVSTTSYVEVPETRYLAPAAVPILIVILLILDAVARSARPFTQPIVLALGVLLLGGHMTSSFALVLKSYYEGGVYAAAEWQNSPVIARVRELKDQGAVVYLNNPYAGYLLAGFDYSDPRFVYEPDRWMAQVFPTLPSDREIYFAWVPRPRYEVFETEPYVPQVPHEIVFQADDAGVIYRLR